MKVYYVIDEASPLYKIGGLGDVGGSLPKVLQQLGIDVSLVLPRHPSIIIDQSWEITSQFNLNYGGQILPVKIWRGLLPQTGVPTYLIEENTYLSQHTDASDNHADKFAVFCFACSVWVSLHRLEDRPNIMHLNDWHTALIPLIDKHILHTENLKYIVTIHNLMYQAITTTPVLEKLALPQEACQIATLDGMDHNINILLEGLLHADIITTVSQQYAKEILTAEYGQSINEILKLRQKDIIGIINGLDVDSFNSATDPLIYTNFTVDNFQAGKLKNKLALQQELGLSIDGQTVMIGYVGRVDPQQKGIELIIEALANHTLIKDKQQFVFLGTGDLSQEKDLHQAGDQLPNVKIITRFDEPLARKIYAASDYLLIPSKFEPCGLIQMIANRYGALPVARATGGLVDTVIPGENGFIFESYDSVVMVEALQNAIKIGENIDEKNRLIVNAMQKDFSWGSSAERYRALYETLS